jgi:hypothetical protein
MYRDHQVSTAKLGDVPTYSRADTDDENITNALKIIASKTALEITALNILIAISPFPYRDSSLKGFSERFLSMAVTRMVEG